MQTIFQFGRIFRVVVALLGLLPAVSAADAPKIGVITDLSGPMGFWGEETRVGAELALEDGHRRGRAVSLIVSDHKLDTKTAVSETQRLVKIEHVDALYVEFTPTSIAASSVLRGQSIPLVYSAAATSPLATYPDAFKTYLDYEAGCEMLLRFWKEKGVVKPVALKATAEFGELCFRGARKVYPEIAAIDYNFGDDLRTHLLQAKKLGADGILNATFEPDAQTMLRRLHELRYAPFVGTQEEVMKLENLKIVPELEEKITVFGFDTVQKDFSNRVRERSPALQTGSLPAAALAYIHISQLIEALSSCVPRDAQCVESKLSLSPPSEVANFLRWDHRIAQFRIALKIFRAGELQRVDN